MSIFMIFQGIANLNLIPISILITNIYLVWAVGQFYDKKKAASYIKVMLSYILAVFAIAFLMLFVGTFIDIIKTI
jgi:hypothetical protein